MAAFIQDGNQRIPIDRATLLQDDDQSKALILPRHGYFVLVAEEAISVNDGWARYRLLQHGDVIRVGEKVFTSLICEPPYRRLFAFA